MRRMSTNMADFSSYIQVTLIHSEIKIKKHDDEDKPNRERNDTEWDEIR